MGELPDRIIIHARNLLEQIQIASVDVNWDEGEIPCVALSNKVLFARAIDT